MEPLDNWRRGQNTYYIFILLGLFTLGFSIRDYSSFYAFEKGELEFYSMVNGVSSVYTFFTIVNSLVALIAIIVFLKWFSRAYSNLHRTKLKNLKFKKGWAVGAWFVPILNTILPFLIMLDLNQRLEEFNENRNEHYRLRPQTTYLIYAWWLLWIVPSIVYIIYALSVMNTSNLTFETAVDLYKFGVYLNFANTLSIGILVLVVQQLIQKEKAFKRIVLDYPKGTFNLSESDEILD